MVDFIFTLFMLILLQAVLGFDNLLYISLESKRAPKDKQAFVRRMGIGLAVGLRIVLLFVVVNLVKAFQDPLFALPNLGSEVEVAGVHGGEPHKVHSILQGEFNFHAIIVLFGGAFILYTAVKEIFHMIATHDLSQGMDEKPASVKKTIFLIVLMNLIFSFDSILSAMALARPSPEEDPSFVLMAIAILVSGALMIWLSDRVAAFLQKNRMFEVLGLFVLLIVGVMLLTEGAHLADLYIGGNPITPMTKTTFYFVIGVLVLTDIVQGRYQKKILAKQEAQAAKAQTAS